MLTTKQHELLKFIDRSLRENGISPSYDEMKVAMGLSSKSGIHRLVTALEERGFIRRLPNRARAMEIAKLPESMERSLAPRRSGFEPSVVDGSRREATASIHRDDRVSSIPMMGRIAAGTPIEAIQSHTHSIAVPPEMLNGGEHYALEVRGDSMIEAGIFDGDTVVVRRQDDASNGEIVVALIDGEEATLKRLRRKGTMIGLEAANAAYETRILPSDRVSIQGRMVGLMRKY